MGQVSSRLSRKQKTNHNFFLYGRKDQYRKVSTNVRNSLQNNQLKRNVAKKGVICKFDYHSNNVIAIDLTVYLHN